jgi:hypothetical protein
MIENMKNFINDPKNSKKLHVYSAVGIYFYANLLKRYIIIIRTFWNDGILSGAPEATLGGGGSHLWRAF